MEKLDFLSPYIRVASDSVIDPPWALRERVIFDYELLYIKGGRVRITVEDTVYDGEPGDIFLFRPRQRHSLTPLGDGHFHQPHLHFDLFSREDSEEVRVSFRPLEAITEAELCLFRKDDTAPGCPMELPTKLTVRSVPFFESRLFEVIRRHNEPGSYRPVAEKAAFLELWSYLLAENHSVLHPRLESWQEEMRAIREYLDDAADRNVTLDELSRRFHRSKYHLLRLFKEMYGVTPVAYARTVKLRKARELVQYSDLPIAEIAARLGFGSPGAFTRAFENREGVPPSFCRGR